jgi:hypothetical protein
VHCITSIFHTDPASPVTLRSYYFYITTLHCTHVPFTALTALPCTHTPLHHPSLLLTTLTTLTYPHPHHLLGHPHQFSLPLTTLTPTGTTKKQMQSTPRTVSPERPQQKEVLHALPPSDDLDRLAERQRQAHMAAPRVRCW